MGEANQSNDNTNDNSADTKLKKTFSKASDLNAIDDKVSVKSDDEKDSHALDSKQDIKFKESDEKSISGDEEEKIASNGKASEAIDPWSVSKEEVSDENDTNKKASDTTPEQPQST